MTRRPRVVLLPGFGGRPSQPVLVRLARRLEALGYECVRLAPPRGRPTPGLEREVAWLEAQLDEAPGAVAVVGRSFGGRVGVRVARRLRALVLLGFPVRPPGRPRPLDEAALAAARCPTLVVQGTKDPLGPLRVVRAAAAKNPRVEVLPLAGATHAFGRHEARALDEAAAWLDRTLGGR